MYSLRLCRFCHWLILALHKWTKRLFINALLSLSSSKWPISKKTKHFFITAFIEYIQCMLVEWVERCTGVKQCVSLSTHSIYTYIVCLWYCFLLVFLLYFFFLLILLQNKMKICSQLQPASSLKSKDQNSINIKE